MRQALACSYHVVGFELLRNVLFQELLLRAVREMLVHCTSTLVISDILFPIQCL